MEQREALKIFADSYKQMLASDLRLNEVVFACALTAVRNLLPYGNPRTSAVSTVFQRCKDEGLCSVFVLRKLQYSLNTIDLRKVVGSENVLAAENGNAMVDYGRIPLEWKRNVKEKTDRRR